MDDIFFDDNFNYYETQHILEAEDMVLHHWDPAIVTACRYARRAYVVINESIFNGELPGAYIAYYSPEEESEDDSTFAFYEAGIIAFNIENIPHSAIACLNRLAHEMVHQYCDIKGIKDTDGAYHTEHFKEISEKAGLECEYKNDFYGYNITRLTDAFIGRLSKQINEI